MNLKKKNTAFSKKRIKSKSKPYPKKEKTHAKEGVRLNKFIANTGICSRREADKFIEAGVVTVNGVGVTKMGTRVKLTDEVKFNGKKLKSEALRYILLNKPKNYSGRINYTGHHTSVMLLIKNACKEKVYPVDKLNKLETGLLLFTNDTDIAKKLSSSKRNIKQIFQATLDKKLTQEDLEKIREGLFLNGKTIKFDSISYIKGKDKTEIGIENSIGGIKQIKKILERFKYKITKLDRVFFAGLTKKDLPRKHYRDLTQNEINILNRI